MNGCEKVECADNLFDYYDRIVTQVRTVGFAFLMVLFSVHCTIRNPETRTNCDFSSTITLLPASTSFEVEQVRRGAVGFTASIRNEGTKTITIAHPSICFTREYKQGEIKRFNDSHGKSEVLLKIRKPDGAHVALRDGYFHCFDPDNVCILKISPDGKETFHVGWFFQNARGRWERDDLAAEVFVQKGVYTISILFRNVFPKALLYDRNAKKISFIDVWTGEMESDGITIEVK